MLIALTFLTGVVDACSYLKLGHVFVANMTGNIVFLGFAIAGAHGLSSSSSLIALGSFLLGALAGGHLGARYAQHRGHLLRSASVLQGTLMIIALTAALLVSKPLDTLASYGLLVPMALAMGVQNSAAQRLAVPELTTTVLTRTLTGIASDAGPALRTSAGRTTFARRVLAVAAMLLGALTGGLLVLHVSIAAAIAVAVTLVLLVALAVHLLSRADAPWVPA
jgi:uncharacterized membrane protein YoaK (UPF0700 family)